ncbi:MAG TPA: type II toxin-antitoxin system PemK/MazF family toxin [Rubrobacteraceae bacterium]|nr:type II toxin-antitoxin system PemK/MazF family toxin [Rubrobacteraceae bacterium]
MAGVCWTKKSGDPAGRSLPGRLREPGGSEPGYRRPAVVVQNDLFNTSNIRTVVVCALTTNLRRAGAPGNVLLDPGEANLLQQSVVNISQVFTVDQRDLVEKIGSLDSERASQVISGINLLLEPREVEDVGG